MLFLWLLLSFVVGVIFTIFVLGLCRASGRSDLEYEIMELQEELRRIKDEK